MGLAPIRVALLTAGKDPHYALGLAPALAEAGVHLDVIGNSEMEVFPKLQHQRIQFFNLRGDQTASVSNFEKVRRVLLYYLRLIRFSWSSRSDIFHILWPNKFVYFDRTILNIYYRALGKRLVFTAHNVNTEERDRKDSFLNRLSLKIQYALMDHIFVHTKEMQSQLSAEYDVPTAKISILTFPINNVTPHSNINRQSARTSLGLMEGERTLLFFGNIAPYKGLEDLVKALPEIRKRLGKVRLVIAGNTKTGEEAYLDEIRDIIKALKVSDLVEERITYIPEEEVELYFKAADLLVLPYRRIFQSGVLFLSYAFGLPVAVADAGSLRDDVLIGQTGIVFRKSDPQDLAEQVSCYFRSDLFADLDNRREWIIDYATKTYSWKRLATKTADVYASLAEVVHRSVTTTLSRE